jgi:hypothetical protein
MGREERRQLGAEAIQDAHDNESGNNAGESEAKNVAYMVSSNASPGLVRGQGDFVRIGVRNIHRILLEATCRGAAIKMKPGLPGFSLRVLSSIGAG